MKGYLANGLFTIGDRYVNETIAIKLREQIKGLELYVPQENAEINNKENCASSIQIAEADTRELLDSDFLIAVIDGVEIDSGVAAEIGIFSTTGKPIFALYSDIRQLGNTDFFKVDALMADATENQFMYRNLFVIGLIKQSKGCVSFSIEELVKNIKGELT